MKKRLLQAGILLAAIIFTGTGCIEIIQFNLFQALEKPNLSADHLNTLSQAEILETAETLNDSGDSDTYTDEEIGNLTGKLDDIIDTSASHDDVQAAAGFAGNIVLTAGGGNDVINNFVGVIPGLQAANISADMQTLRDALIGVFGADLSETEFLKKIKSILDAAVYYEKLANSITNNGMVITDNLNAGEIAQFGAISLILKDALIAEDDPSLSALYAALYTGDATDLSGKIDTTAFDFDNTAPDNLDTGASVILTSTGFMGLVR